MSSKIDNLLVNVAPWWEGIFVRVVNELFSWILENSWKPTTFGVFENPHVFCQFSKNPKAVLGTTRLLHQLHHQKRGKVAGLDPRLFKLSHTSCGTNLSSHYENYFWLVWTGSVSKGFSVITSEQPQKHLNLCLWHENMNQSGDIDVVWDLCWYYQTISWFCGLFRWGEACS